MRHNSKRVNVFIHINQAKSVNKEDRHKVKCISYKTTVCILLYVQLQQHNHLTPIVLLLQIRVNRIIYCGTWICPSDRIIYNTLCGFLLLGNKFYGSVTSCIHFLDKSDESINRFYEREREYVCVFVWREQSSVDVLFIGWHISNLAIWKMY